MGSTEWKVKVATGELMCGVHTFRTKARALVFIRAWRIANPKSATGSITLFRY